eukprot:358645-Chlamydomonas_euryale.AAC.10
MARANKQVHSHPGQSRHRRGSHRGLDLFSHKVLRRRDFIAKRHVQPGIPQTKAEVQAGKRGAQTAFNDVLVKQFYVAWSLKKEQT